MSEQPSNDALVDDDLDAAVGGALPGDPLATGDDTPFSGPENNVGATSC